MKIRYFKNFDDSTKFRVMFYVNKKVDTKILEYTYSESSKDYSCELLTVWDIINKFIVKANTNLGSLGWEEIDRESFDCYTDNQITRNNMSDYLSEDEICISNTNLSRCNKTELLIIKDGLSKIRNRVADTPDLRKGVLLKEGKAYYIYTANQWSLLTDPTRKKHCKIIHALLCDQTPRVGKVIMSDERGIELWYYDLKDRKFVIPSKKGEFTLKGTGFDDDPRRENACSRDDVEILIDNM